MKQVETIQNDRILTPNEYKEIVKQRNKRIQEENRDSFKEYAKLLRKEIVSTLSLGENITFIKVIFQNKDRVPQDFLISEEYQSLKEELKEWTWKLNNYSYAWGLTPL